MLFRIAAPAALLTACGLVYGLIRAERNAPLAEKPSILLRVWSGELPSADLSRVLAQTTAQLDAARQAHEQALAARAAHEKMTQVGMTLLQQLEQRIAEKQATEWASSPSPATPR